MKVLLGTYALPSIENGRYLTTHELFTQVNNRLKAIGVSTATFSRESDQLVDNGYTSHSIIQAWVDPDEKIG